MFINYIKALSLKKILNSTLQPVKDTLLVNSVKKVGLLLEDSYSFKKEELINELINKGFKRDNIKVLVYRDPLEKKVNLTFPTFSFKDINWNGQFSAPFVNEFIYTPFDLLISYYDVEKAPLLLVTHNSKALFKVGFSTIDKRLNHLIINTNAQNFKIFLEELVKYLKILKRI
ncbi:MULTISPECIES: DUF6913 domain-containing protein [Flavobacterium]|uniref:Uncharacterized protein n=1 Tax=Flavobacterium covae TaxID=2906076 RepID=A0ABW8PI98_9FLAO|nr:MULTISPECIES: hypothetical protein [Flavobacterium]AMA48577.1 hypothetical protein AWN65_03435 [Flavobacterium covae]AND65297.1 hypothetical protein AX766_13330 [Flavobacterium covae]MCJ1807904.1 hypothetical protein [Flavobacterium covae]OWP80438.1 hypothetical protein BWK63_11085 [Flavobacterium covae]OWP85959.1 hypothetical protein BWK60_11345 [Flavobacterium covae]